MNLRLFRLTVLAILMSFSGPAPLCAAVTWFPLGPFGGDARSFAADPRDASHLYLGTATGWVYESLDAGSSWKRVAQIANRNDLVIDHILVDPKVPNRLLVAAWTADHPDGGVWISDDSGATWHAQAQMHGQAVLAMSRSVSDPNILIAGTLRGVYRSQDNGAFWQQISPEASTEIHEVESIAIDPVNPDVIYAGTWHLPWKTTDGGAHWQNIKHGIIDDSDVFSIIVDPMQPKIVYASACSGIYKSVDAAAEFKKIQGIPSTARRTRKLAQDPKHLDTVYAGTTEGLYRTIDAGEHWDLLTGPDLIVNDIYIDPANPDHVLLATDRGGVLASDNAGETFRSSNTGFSARQVTAYAADPLNPAHLYVGVVNDKATGGVFSSTDGGVRWSQKSNGLGGRDVFSLVAAPDNVVVAGTNHGIFRLQDDFWVDSSALRTSSPTHTVAAKVPAKARSTHARTPVTESKRATGPMFDGLVYTLVPDVNAIYAGTSGGLLRGDATGSSWSPVTSLSLHDVRSFSLQGPILLAADLHTVELSLNDGVNWKPVSIPSVLTQVSTVAVDGHRTIWVGGREGLFYSADNGVAWHQVPNLLLAGVDSAYYDASADRLLVTTSQSNFVFSVQLPDDKVTFWDTGWKLRFARPVGDHMVAATLYDGMVLQPQMVVSDVGPTRLNDPRPKPPAAAGNAPTGSTTSAETAAKH